ncbi:uncharacterized protein LOC135475163 [Liolophura sinensis]|uniref:uncharacterized protein LOC135475163 n=1 Tax=Liolophura sinensis TaxID=3198878 RepID=UPI003159457E
MHSPNMRERTPSRDPSYSNSPRPQRQEPRVSPRQTSPQSSVIQSPVGNSLQVQESQVPQKATSAPSPLPEDGNKQSKSMKQISKHEPIQSLLGNHAPNDILYLICRVCNQTYGSPYGFRRHFRNQHRFEPQAHHTLVQTISETRSALHPPGLEGSEMPPTLEVQSSPGLQHPPANSDGQMDRLLDIDRHSPVTISDSLPEQKGVIANGVGSDSRPSSVMSGTEGKSDSSSGSEDKCLSSRSKLSTDPEDSQERRFLSCQECGEKFQLNDFGLYKKHCRAHEKERQGKFKCTDCRSSFCESHQMQDQQFRQGSTVKRSHLCHLCNLFFPNSTALAQHIEMDHRLEEIQQHELRQQAMQQCESYECIPCKQQFKDLQTYVEHQQVCLCASDESKGKGGEEEKLPAQSCASVESPDASLGRNEDSQQAVKSGPNSPVVNTGDLVWKKKSAIKLSQPESNSSLAPVFVNGDSKDSTDESADLYRHKKFSRLPAKRRDSDLESLDSVSSSSKKMKLDVPPVEEARRTSSCSSTAPSPAGSSVRSACSSPNSAIDEPSVKTDFKKHSKFAKGMKYVSGLNTKGDVSPSPDAGNSGSKSLRDKSKSDEGTTRVKRGDRKDKNKKSGGDKAEARHQLPFVWDRVTRSKAVKHAKK